MVDNSKGQVIFFLTHLNCVMIMFFNSGDNFASQETRSLSQTFSFV